MTRVVHCKRSPFDVYIGRPGPFGNPYVIGKDGDRDEVIAKFERFVRANPKLMERIRNELTGKTLGCWCAPKPCHGDVLARICDEVAK